MSEEFNEKTLIQQDKKADVALEEIEVLEIAKAREIYDKSGYTEARDIALKILGQNQIYQAYAKFNNAASLAQLMYVKENKTYRHMAGYKYVDSDGKNSRMPPTWDGYLNAIGLKARTVDEQILDCKTVGNEAYEAMNRIGISTRDFRKLRQIESNERSIIIDDIKANLNDENEIIKIIDKVKSGFDKKEAGLEKTTENLTADLEASRQRVTEQSEEVTDLKAKLYHRDNFSAYPDLVNSIRVQCVEASGEILITLDKFEQIKNKIQFSDLGEYKDDDGAIDPMIQSYWSMLWQVQARVADLIDDAQQTYGDIIDRTITNRAYPDIDDSLRGDIQTVVDEQVDAIKAYAKPQGSLNN